MQIPKVRILGADGFLELPDKQFVLDLQSFYEPLVLNNPIYSQRFFNPIGVKWPKWKGRYFSVMGVFCRTYYHWMHDVLAQFHLAGDYLPCDVKIIVPGPLNELRSETLEAVGISRNRVVEHFSNMRARVETLFFIPPPCHSRFDDPAAACWLRGKLRARFVSQGIKPFRRLFISREKALCRRIRNEMEVASFLNRNGFQTIHCEDLSIHEQARLFGEAEYIVAPHGAGLVNLIFSNPGTRVLEIFPGDNFHTCYWSLCCALDHNYLYMCAPPVSNGDAEPDLLVDLGKLEYALSMLDSSSDAQG